MALIRPLMDIIGFAALVFSASYAVLALVAVLVWQLRKGAIVPHQLLAVTVLKPLCGAEPGLYEHLRSFCQQDYPNFQIVFGVRDPADPAIAVAERLVAEFPSIPIEVVINPQQHGSNCKVSNLINMVVQARHDVLVMADSDTFVEPDYLSSVTAPLLDRDVGLITCIYRGVPTRQIWSRLGAMYINEWYMPSVLLAWLFGHQGYVSGQTMCLRRDTLRAIGGLRAIANDLAEDHRLGELIRELGQRIVLSPYVLKAQHYEPDLESLSRHEQRWLRTIRVLQPLSFCFIFTTFSLPLAIFGIALAGAEPSLSATGWALFQIAVMARLALRIVHRRPSDRSFLWDVWLVPVRDLLTCWAWGRTFFISRVTWRGREFDVDANGVMRRLS